MLSHIFGIGFHPPILSHGSRLCHTAVDIHVALASGQYDGWHFAGYGSYRSSDPNRSAIYLEQQETLTPEDLSGVASNLGRAKPIVFFNACQIGRSAMSLTDIGGWARQFLHAGAGAFIGTYWLVDDKHAFDFARAFYSRLLAGIPIGKAVQEARAAIKSRGNPTWLAYTAYADPLATVSPLPNLYPDRIAPHEVEMLTQTDAKDQQPSPPAQKSKEQWLDEGITLKNLKRYEEALAAYDQAIRLDLNYAAAHTSKGIALSELKRYEEALAAYDQALRLNPNDVIAYNNKGVALAEFKRYEEALAAYDQAIRLNPSYALAYNNKGSAFERLGKKREAQQAFRRARQLGYRR